MKNDFMEREKVNAALIDLSHAYEQVAEIAKTATRNSRAKKLSVLALDNIERGFKQLSAYGSDGVVSELRDTIESARIIPTV